MTMNRKMALNAGLIALVLLVCAATALIVACEGDDVDPRWMAPVDISGTWELQTTDSVTWPYELYVAIDQVGSSATVYRTYICLDDQCDCYTSTSPATYNMDEGILTVGADFLACWSENYRFETDVDMWLVQDVTNPRIHGTPFDKTDSSTEPVVSDCVKDDDDE